MIKTFRYRLKSKNLSFLKKASHDVNFVWNYCNDTSLQFLCKKDKWLTGYQLSNLTAGCSKSLSITSQTIQTICELYAKRRSQFKKPKLAWRSKKRSLAWIPFKNGSIRVCGDTVIYRKTTFRFWKSMKIDGVVKSGSFNQDAAGNWYVSLVCECESSPKIKSGGEVGIDLGLKTIATLSNGICLNRDNVTTKYADKLATAQRAKKKKQVTKIHDKIKNIRKDWNHKQTTKLINSFDRIIVGNVSPSKLKKTYMAKSVSDAGWADFKSMLAYKAIALGVEFKEVKENFSTVTCSTCFERTGPSGLSALGVREWICKCGATHNRDVNAAKNILRFGCEAPIKGVSSLEKDIKDSKTEEYTKENMTKEQQFNLPHAAVFNLQQIALADDEMVKAPGAAEKYRFIARHILELFTSSGSVAAPKEEVTLGVGDGSGQHFVSGSYDTIKLLQGKLIELESYRLSYTFEEDGETGLSLLDRLTPPGDTDISRGRDEIQLLAEEIELHYSKELACLRQQLKEREEALKELLPIVERKFNGISIDDAASHREYIALKAIIDRARKLLSK